MAKSMALYNVLWSQGNDEGRGYSACACTSVCRCNVNKLRHLGKLVHKAESDDGSVAVYMADDGGLTAVSDLNGPWAVDIDLPTLAHEWFEQFGGNADLALENAEAAPAEFEPEFESNGFATLTFNDGSCITFSDVGVFFDRPL